VARHFHVTLTPTTLTLGTTMSVSYSEIDVYERIPYRAFIGRSGSVMRCEKIFRLARKQHPTALAGAPAGGCVHAPRTDFKT
jgi:hypothetical protein